MNIKKDIERILLKNEYRDSVTDELLDEISNAISKLLIEEIEKLKWRVNKANSKGLARATSIRNNVIDDVIKVISQLIK